MVEDTAAELVSLRPDTKFVEDANEGLLIGHRWGVHRIGRPPDGFRGCLEQLLAGSMRVPPSRTGHITRLQRLFAHIYTAFPFLLVRTILSADGVRLLRLEPLGKAAQSSAVTLTAETRLMLSRFVYFRRLDGEFVMESPLALYRASLLTPELGGVVAALTRPRSVGELVQEHGVECRVLAELVGAGLLHTVEPGGDEPSLPEDDARRLRSWSFHDLLFHTRSRSGRHDYPAGGTFPFRDREPFLPAVKPAVRGERVRLFRPDLTEVAARDVSLTEVLESRRSVRTYGPCGMSADQLGEFLYRTLRVRYRVGPLSEDSPYQSSSRPYPSGGAVYDTETYLVVHRCEGLARGVYHYDPLAHELRVLHGSGPGFKDLFGSYRTAVPAAPDVLFVFTSRFGRLSLKYESISYGVALRNLGALYQTLYLVATSMSLAACAVGIGDIEATSRALGVEFTEEPAIGEFVLGSMPPNGDAAAELYKRRLEPTFLDGNDSDWAAQHSRLLRREDQA